MRIDDLRQKLRLRGLRCHPMYCRNSTRMQIVPLLASRSQALRYINFAKTLQNHIISVIYLFPYQCVWIFAVQILVRAVEAERGEHVRGGRRTGRYGLRGADLRHTQDGDHQGACDIGLWCSSPVNRPSGRHRSERESLYRFSQCRLTG